jgi:hypothetical protein
MREGDGADSEARNAALMSGLASPFALAMAYLSHRLGHAIWPWCLVAAVAAGYWVVLLVWPRAPRRLSLSAFVATALLHQLAITVILQSTASRGQPFVPFNGQKLAALWLAVFIPSELLGAILIGLEMVVPLALYFSWSTAQRQLVPGFEPLLTVFVAIAALPLLREQRALATAVRALARSRAERAWRERVARLSLWARDLTNTPLQNLLLVIPTLRQVLTADAVVVDEIEGAVNRLARLNSSLKPLDRLLHWTHKDLGFSALPAIEQDVAAMLRERAEPVPATTLAGHAVDPVREGRRSALAMSSILLVGALLFLLRAGDVAARWSWGVLCLLGAAGIVVTLARPALPRAASLAIIIAQSLAALVAGWLQDAPRVATHGPSDVFNVSKLLAILLAFLSPSRWVGTCLVGIAFVLPLVQYFGWSPDARSGTMGREPFNTVIFCCSAIVILGMRTRHTAYLRQIARQQAESAWFTRVTRLTLVLRDLSRPSLETLRASLSVLRRNAPPAVSARCERMVGRIESLSAALEPLAPLVSPRLVEPGASEERFLDEEVAQLTESAPP